LQALAAAWLFLPIFEFVTLGPSLTFDCLPAWITDKDQSVIRRPGDRRTSLMPKRPTADMIAEGLTVPERVLLFCAASATDWQKAGVMHATARLIRGLIDRQAAASFTEQGRTSSRRQFCVPLVTSQKTEKIESNHTGRCKCEPNGDCDTQPVKN
jgi:hypothetical protein